MGDSGGEGLDTGSSVLAKYSVDGLDYRARIQEVVFKEEDGLEAMYRVSYVDYANSGVVFGKELVVWDSHLDILSEQAVSCRLEGAPALWREEGGATWRLSRGQCGKENSGCNSGGSSESGIEILENQGSKLWCG